MSTQSISADWSDGPFSKRGPLEGITAEDVGPEIAATLKIPAAPQNSYAATSHAELEVLANGEPLPVPGCPYDGGSFTVTAEGVTYVKGERSTVICSPIHVKADTRDERGNSWGRWLEWRDRDGRQHTWAMPVSLLHGEPGELLKELASRGLVIQPRKGSLLLAYLQLWPTDTRLRCVDRLGWCDSLYITPDGPAGAIKEKTVYQPSSSVQPAFSVKGTAEQWRDGIAALARGNSRLVFAISAAFAGPLLEMAGEDSGGLHFVGGSSSGKTTALKVAASVWGGPDSVRQWRATANGLEGLAAAHNDGCLILDELSQIDGRQAGEAAYMLCNGMGKARANVSGAARQAARWRLVLLSSGEVALSDHMAASQKRINAGQELRLANIAADAGAGMGIFQDTHGHDSPAAFAVALKAAAGEAYGAAGRVFLNSLVKDRAAMSEAIAKGIADFTSEVLPVGASGQVARVARRFAVIAVAGEIATRWGLTGWDEGNGSDAAAACFKVWLADYGHGNREDDALVSHVRLFLEQHGASRFQSMKAGAEESTVHNRAGFWREDGGVRQYLVTPETWKAEIVAGFNKTLAPKILMDAGLLITRNDGRSNSPETLPGIGRKRVHILTLGPEVEE